MTGPYMLGMGTGMNVGILMQTGMWRTYSGSGSAPLKAMVVLLQCVMQSFFRQHFWLWTFNQIAYCMWKGGQFRRNIATFILLLLCYRPSSARQQGGAKMPLSTGLTFARCCQILAYLLYVKKQTYTCIILENINTYYYYLHQISLKAMVMTISISTKHN